MLANTIQPSEVLIQSTRIEGKQIDGKISVGTGFHYFFLNKQYEQEKKLGIPAIVTNKHVVEKISNGFLYINRRGSNGQPQYGNPVKLQFKGEDWIHHPESPAIDLSILLLKPQCENQGIKIDELFLVRDFDSIIPEDNQWQFLSPLEDIIMVGYPNGYWDEKNVTPISRRGITASHPKLNYEEKPRFLIDIPIFPGTSGSPVFSYGYVIEYLKGGHAEGNRCLFLGILYAGMNYNKNKPSVSLELISTENDKKDLMSNLGVVIKSTKLKDFEPFLKQNIEVR